MHDFPIIGNIQRRQGAYLPHWRADNASYFVTFRLAGSLPSSVMHEIEFSRKDILQTADYVKRSLSNHEIDQLEELHFRELDLLRIERGACFLKDDCIARIVADAFRYFDHERYQLFAWSIMPNHVHVVFRPFPDWDASDILHSWKSFTAHAANNILKRTGPFWQKEPYDHLIRNADDLQRCIDYTWSNPEKAGLRAWKWKWKTETTVDNP